ncbi:hypothetical protein [Elongatibacter sediminis]|uniref:Uncharacterized protein n=1 Tax=Elongatibacter sediminis TaxID=3119006 RepID=A0AAW9RF89_9GAMM
MIEQRDIAKQRSRAVVTAWILAAVAAGIFAAYVLAAVLAQ